MVFEIRITKMEKGIYTIKRWDKETFAIIPEKLEVFGNIYEKDSEKIKILIYLNEEKINTSNEFVLFLGYALSIDSDFEVYIATNLDPLLIENADIIIEDIGTKNFIRKLERYDNGSKIFITKKNLKEIKQGNFFPVRKKIFREMYKEPKSKFYTSSKNDFKSFARMLKSWISGKSRKREVLV